jgi:flagellar protein FlgJ
VNGLKGGMTVKITCQQSGELVRGPLRNTKLWDHLSIGGYVSDALVNHPIKRGPIPRCASAATADTIPPAKDGISANSASFLTAIAGGARQGFRDYRVPASVTMAQAILESGWGKSKLTANDKNYFGIKCFGSPGAIAINCHTYVTQECTKAGVCYTTTAVFRVYRSASDSFRDHALFLAERSRYAAAFKYSTVPDKFAAEIHKAGYATDPKYTSKLIGLMKSYDLYRYDR